MKRIVFLVDMNAFFISCEMSRNPWLKGKPAAVAGDPKNRMGIILAANYDARKYGIRTTMLVHEAKKLYPDILLVPPDHEFYEIKSREVMEILSRYTPVVQQNSIDEAWLDMTGCQGLFGEPAETAGRIMADIRRELDLWCSIGISDNKFLAKMASEMKKPLGITEIWQNDIETKIWPLKVREMYGIGKQTEKKLASLSVFTIGELAVFDKSILAKVFGKYGEELHRLANGIDPSPVTEHPHYDSKSIGRSTTLPRDTTDLEYAKSVLMRLSEEVGMEARRYAYKGKTVSIVIKYGDFQAITRQKSVTPTFLTKDIYNTGISLLADNWDLKRPVRLLGISLANIHEDFPEQISIFDMNEAVPDAGRREEKLEKAMDEIRIRFGRDIIKRAKLVGKEPESDKSS